MAAPVNGISLSSTARPVNSSGKCSSKSQTLNESVNSLCDYLTDARRTCTLKSIETRAHTSIYSKQLSLFCLEDAFLPYCICMCTHTLKLVKTNIRKVLFRCHHMHLHALMTSWYNETKPWKNRPQIWKRKNETNKEREKEKSTKRWQSFSVGAKWNVSIRIVRSKYHRHWHCWRNHKPRSLAWHNKSKKNDHIGPANR